MDSSEDIKLVIGIINNLEVKQDQSNNNRYYMVSKDYKKLLMKKFHAESNYDYRSAVNGITLNNIKLFEFYGITCTGNRPLRYLGKPLFLD